MPCRAASLCRQAAANSSQCLWITDDILADAWNRFARVSIANRSKSDGRRYGSNVPGPLEARRRSAKRRMGVAAATATGAPPAGLDFGAIFGWRASHQDFKVGEFSYQAPGEQSRKVKEKERSSSWLFGGKQKKEQELWSQFLEIPEAEEQEDAIEASKNAFADLLAAKERDANSQQYDGLHDLDDVLDFLRSSADEPAADNLLTLEQWLSTQRISASALESVCDLVIEKVRLQSVNIDTIATIITAWLNNPHRPSKHTTKVLDSLTAGGDLMRSVCTTTTEVLCKNLTASDSITDALKVWLESLRACYHLQGWQCKNSTWHAIYHILADQFPRPSLLAEHFAVISGANRTEDLSRILLRHWVPRFIDASKSNDAPQIATVTEDKRHLSWPVLDQVKIHDIVQYFDHLRSTRYPIEGVRKREYLRRTSSPLVDLLCALAHHGIPAAEFSIEIFSIITASQPPFVAYAFFRQMCWIMHLPIHDDLALLSIDYFRKQNRLDFALSVFRACATVSSVHCVELAIALARNGVAAKTIFEILMRQRPDTKIPLAMRSRRKLTLTDEHIAMVHSVAFTFADTPKVTSALGFRRAWQCYLFLQDRGAPISPVLTRALVNAGIIRPVKELKRPSVDRVRYILSLVERVEGREVAKELDRVLHELWQSDVLPKQKAAERARRATVRWEQETREVVSRNPAMDWVWDRALGQKKQRPLVKARFARDRSSLVVQDVFPLADAQAEPNMITQQYDPSAVAADVLVSKTDLDDGVALEWRSVEALSNQTAQRKHEREENTTLDGLYDPFQAAVRAADQWEDVHMAESDTHPDTLSDQVAQRHHERKDVTTNDGLFNPFQAAVKAAEERDDVHLAGSEMHVTSGETSVQAKGPPNPAPASSEMDLSADLAQLDSTDVFIAPYSPLDVAEVAAGEPHGLKKLTNSVGQEPLDSTCKAEARQWEPFTSSKSKDTRDLMAWSLAAEDSFAQSEEAAKHRSEEMSTTNFATTTLQESASSPADSGSVTVVHQSINTKWLRHPRQQARRLAREQFQREKASQVVQAPAAAQAVEDTRHTEPPEQNDGWLAFTEQRTLRLQSAEGRPQARRLAQEHFQREKASQVVDAAQAVEDTRHSEPPEQAHGLRVHTGQKFRRLTRVAEGPRQALRLAYERSQQEEGSQVLEDTPGAQIEEIAPTNLAGAAHAQDSGAKYTPADQIEEIVSTSSPVASHMADSVARLTPADQIAPASSTVAAHAEDSDGRTTRNPLLPPQRQPNTPNPVPSLTQPEHKRAAPIKAPKYISKSVRLEAKRRERAAAIDFELVEDRRAAEKAAISAPRISSVTKPEPNKMREKAAPVKAAKSARAIRRANHMKARIARKRERAAAIDYELDEDRRAAEKAAGNHAKPVDTKTPAYRAIEIGGDRYQDIHIPVRDGRVAEMRGPMYPNIRLSLGKDPDAEK